MYNHNTLQVLKTLQIQIW